MIEDTVGAFCPHGRFALAGADRGPLQGLAFAVKDVIDIAGHVTGAGNPRWLATHGPAARNAPCVDRLLEAGARMVGKTVTDELAYSLHGDNVHYGTPVNINAPGRVPGGSSSGSAAAVAARLCDFALGTDSGGSVRIPASYCGLFGIRTTHGRIALDGVVPFMPSFDTLGWFARRAELLAAVGEVLLPKPVTSFALDRMLIAEDAFAEAVGDTAEALRPILSVAASLFRRSGAIGLAEESLESWRRVYRVVSAAESWRILGDWIERNDPQFAPAIAARFRWARSVTPAAAEEAAAAGAAIGQRIREAVGTDSVLCIPTAPGPAPRLDAASDAVDAFRERAQRMTCIAGMAGLPQVSLPAARVAAGPVGLSLIGPAGSDEGLLALAIQLEAALSATA